MNKIKENIITTYLTQKENYLIIPEKNKKIIGYIIAVDYEVKQKKKLFYKNKEIYNIKNIGKKEIIGGFFARWFLKSMLNKKFDISVYGETNGIIKKLIFKNVKILNIGPPLHSLNEEKGITTTFKAEKILIWKNIGETLK